MLVLHDFYLCIKNESTTLCVSELTSSMYKFGIFTQSWVVLSHLNFFNTVSRKPTSSSFNASFPESSFTNRQNCGSTAHSHQHLCTHSPQIVSPPYRTTDVSHSSLFLTFDPLSSVQLDFSRPLGDVGPGGDEGASWYGTVQSSLPHLRGQGRGGRRAGLHMTSTTRAADSQVRHMFKGPTSILSDSSYSYSGG